MRCPGKVNRRRFIYCISHVESWFLDKSNSEYLGHETGVFQNDRAELVPEVSLLVVRLLLLGIILFGCEQMV